MKDAISGTTLIKIFLTFFIIFIILMSSIINYTKTYRIKNQIINIIERNNGYNPKTIEEINEFMKKASIIDICIDVNDIEGYKGNRCEIQERGVEGNEILGKYYKIAVYAVFELPLVKQTINIPVRGETKIFYKVIEGSTEYVEYEIMNEEPKLPEFDLEEELIVEDSVNGSPGSSNGSGGEACCSVTICPGYATRKKIGSKYVCINNNSLNTFGVSCDPGAPGTLMTSTGSCCRYSCNPKLATQESGKGYDTKTKVWAVQATCSDTAYPACAAAKTFSAPPVSPGGTVTLGGGKLGGCPGTCPTITITVPKADCSNSTSCKDRCLCEGKSEKDCNDYCGGACNYPKSCYHKCICDGDNVDYCKMKCEAEQETTSTCPSACYQGCICSGKSVDYCNMDCAAKTATTTRSCFDKCRETGLSVSTCNAECGITTTTQKTTTKAPTTTKKNCDSKGSCYSKCTCLGGSSSNCKLFCSGL